jgi:hypothetical protein
MPHTRKIDDLHEVTIRSDRRRSGGWESRGDIFVTATGMDIGVTVHGEGRTMSSAESRAFADARTWCLTRRGNPDQGE